MKRFTSHLVAGIFGVAAILSGSIGIFAALSGSISGLFFGLLGPLFLGIGVFVSGIVEIVQSAKSTKFKGIGLTAGILNVVFAFSSFIPIIGWILPIVGIVFAFVAYFLNL